jgi:hypothetical protein
MTAPLSIVISTTPRFSLPRCAKGRPCASNVSIRPEPVKVNSSTAPSDCVARCVVLARLYDASDHWPDRVTRSLSIAGIHPSAARHCPTVEAIPTRIQARR